MKLPPFRAVTYNIHRATGRDRRHDLPRIAAVLQEINAEIIGLQEVDTGLFHDPEPVIQKPIPPEQERRGRAEGSAPVTTPIEENPSTMAVLKPTPTASQRPHQLAYLTQATGLTAVEGLVVKSRHGEFGNVLLTNHPVKAVRRIDLTIRGANQRRGALDVDIDFHGEPLRIIVTHLGLGIMERYLQVKRVVRALGDDRDARVLIMGDFNMWSTLFARFRRLHRRFGPAPRIRTFPSGFPIFPLDRLWVQPIDALRSIEAHCTPLSRVASDHLPLVGTIQF
jgi:endonuclease/exonuclease/phosphatase family metal-dependent hydrolase